VPGTGSISRTRCCSCRIWAPRTRTSWPNTLRGGVTSTSTMPSGDRARSPGCPTPGRVAEALPGPHRGSGHRNEHDLVQAEHGFLGADEEAASIRDAEAGGKQELGGIALPVQDLAPVDLDRHPLGPDRDQNPGCPVPFQPFPRDPRFVRAEVIGFLKIDPGRLAPLAVHLERSLAAVPDESHDESIRPLLAAGGDPEIVFRGGDPGELETAP